MQKSDGVKVLQTQVVQREQPGKECSQMWQQSILLHARLQILG
jgi:hypothetical protein